MALDNLTAIKKADMAVSDLSGGGSGLLVAEQADTFYKVPILRSVFLPMVTVVKMNNPTQEAPRANGMTGARILRRGTSGQALNTAQRAKPNLLAPVTLTAKLLRGEVRIPDEVFEDNIERQAFANTIREMIGEEIAKDIEDLVLNGDTTSTDDLLSTFDGVIESISSNIVPAGGVYLGKSTLRDVDLTVPKALRQPTSAMRYFTSHKGAIWYRDSQSNRQTGEGDSALVRGFDGDTYARYNGVPVMPVPLISDELGSGNDETVVVYCNPKDIVVGYQRQVTIKTKEMPESGEIAFYVTLRMDMQLKHEPLLVKATGVLVS